jgi:hypothetical protein
MTSTTFENIGNDNGINNADGSDYVDNINTVIVIASTMLMLLFVLMTLTISIAFAMVMSTHC